MVASGGLLACGEKTAAPTPDAPQALAAAPAATTAPAETTDRLEQLEARLVATEARLKAAEAQAAAAHARTAEVLARATPTLPEDAPLPPHIQLEDERIKATAVGVDDGADVPQVDEQPYDDATDPTKAEAFNVDPDPND